MVERESDKWIRRYSLIVEKLEENDESCDIVIDNQDFEMSADEFRKWFEFAERMEQISSSEFFPTQLESPYGEFTSPDAISLSFEVEDADFFRDKLKKLQTEYPKRDKSLLRPQTIELISKAAGDLMSGTSLVKLLKDQGVDTSLIIYPNTKWKMVNDALEYLCKSAKKSDIESLNNVLREVCHPSTHKGNTEQAKKFERRIDSWVQYDGLYFFKGELRDKETENFAGLGDAFHEIRVAEENAKPFLQLIEKERERISKLESVSKLAAAQKEWEDCGKVFSELEKSISRVNDGFQSFSIDFSKLGEAAKGASDILSKLSKEGVFGYTEGVSKAVASTRHLRNYLAGNGIILKDLQKFDRFHTAIDALIKDVRDRQKLLSDATGDVREVITFPDPIPVQTYRQLVPKINHEEIVRNRILEESHRDQVRLQRESNRIAKLAGRSEAEFCIEHLITRTRLMKNDDEKFTAHFSADLGFEDDIDVRNDAIRFFEKLVQIGCFRQVDRIFNGHFSFVAPDLGKLKQELEEWRKPYPQSSKTSSKSTNSSQAKEQTQQIPTETLALFQDLKSWDCAEFSFFNGEERIELIINGVSKGELHFDDLGFKKGSATDTMKSVVAWGMLTTMALGDGTYPCRSFQEGRLKSHHKAKIDLEERLMRLAPHTNEKPIETREGKYISLIKLSSKSIDRMSFSKKGVKDAPKGFLREV